jgi:hypothetical protein
MMNVLSSVRLLISIWLFVKSSLVNTLGHNEPHPSSPDADVYSIYDDTAAIPMGGSFLGVSE